MEEFFNGFNKVASSERSNASSRRRLDTIEHFVIPEKMLSGSIEAKQRRTKHFSFRVGQKGQTGVYAPWLYTQKHNTPFTTRKRTIVKSRTEF